MQHTLCVKEQKEIVKEFIAIKVKDGGLDLNFLSGLDKVKAQLNKIREFKRQAERNVQAWNEGGWVDKVFLDAMNKINPAQEA